MLNRQEQNAQHIKAINTYYQDGDEAVLQQVFIGLAPRIKSFLVTRGVRHAEQLEDLVQETLAATLIALREHRFTGAGAVASWVMSIAWVTLSHSLRHNKWRASEPGRHENPFLTLGSAGATPAEELPINDEDQARASQLITDVTKAVFNLDPNARTAVVLHFFHGLSALGAAAKMGTTETKFRQRLNRGLVALREWARTTAQPTAALYTALRRVNTGDLFRDPLAD